MGRLQPVVYKMLCGIHNLAHSSLFVKQILSSKKQSGTYPSRKARQKLDALDVQKFLILL